MSTGAANKALINSLTPLDEISRMPQTKKDLILANVLAAGGDTVARADVVTVTGAVPGVDAYPLISAAIAKIKSLGGGTVYLPHIGGVGYYISQTLVFDFDDARLLINDNLTLTKLDATDLVGPDLSNQSGVNGVAITAVLFAGRLLGPSAQRRYIKRPRLIGIGRYTISTRADQVTNYSYVVGASGLHAPVVFSGTEDAECINVRVYNGLIGGIAAIYSPRMLIDRCHAELTQYDNGIQILGCREHQTLFNAIDPTTWANVTMRDCEARFCRNHGIGCYGSVGVNIINPVVIGCGNNTPRVDGNGNVTDAGPAGGINVEFDTSPGSAADYHVNIVNPRVSNSWGFGIRSNCLGTRVIGGEVFGTRRPTSYSSHPSYPLWGSAIFAQGYGEISCVDTEIDGSEAYGLRASAASGGFPSISFLGGQIKGCAIHAVYGTGIGRISTSPTTLFIANGNTTDTVSGSQYCINISNGAENVEGGLAIIAGRFEDNYGGIARFTSVGSLDLSKGISGKNNGRAWVSPNIMIASGTRVLELIAANISLFSNGKAARVGQFALAVKALVDRASILGDYTNTQFEAFQIINVTGTYIGGPPTNTSFVNYSATLTPNSTNGNPTFGSPYITGNLTIGADTPSIPPIDGQTITFTLTQDTVGSRTISWHSTWRGATLTSSGAANQRAQVTFRYSGGQWAQISNTGWLDR